MLTETKFNTLREAIPSESSIQSFLSEVHFASSTKPWTLTELAQQVKEYFDIPEDSAKLKLEDYDKWPNSWRYKKGTFLECLTYWATYRCVTVDNTAKEVGKYTWESIKGPDADIGTPRRERKELISAIALSAKILKSLGHVKKEVENLLLTKWYDFPSEIEIAVKRVFKTA